MIECYCDIDRQPVLTPYLEIEHWISCWSRFTRHTIQAVIGIDVAYPRMQSVPPRLHTTLSPARFAPHIPFQAIGRRLPFLVSDCRVSQNVRTYWRRSSLP